MAGITTQRGTRSEREPEGRGKVKLLPPTSANSTRALVTYWGSFVLYASLDYKWIKKKVEKWILNITHKCLGECHDWQLSPAREWAGGYVVDTAAPLPGRYFADSGSPAQDGSAHIPDILSSFLYRGSRWRCVVHV